MPDRLSARQADVLALYAQGLTDKEIAARLRLSLRTVRGHMQGAMSRLHARTRAGALVTALRNGAVTVEGLDVAAPGSAKTQEP